MRKRIRLLVLAAASALAASVARAGAPCPPDFIHAARYAVGNGTSGFSAADLNGDGNPDLVTKSNFPKVVSARLGNADGTFGPSIESPIDLYTYEATVGRFTADVHPDIVMTSFDNLWLLVGNGDGTFDPSVLLGAPLGGLSSADVNDDGKLDVLGTDFNTGEPFFHVLFGNGDGTFQPAVSTLLKVPMTSYALGDTDGDGELDLVMTYYEGNSVAIQPGSGDGTWGAPRFVAAGSNLSDVSLRDLDGDSELDILLASGSYAGVLLGNGGGTFQAPIEYAADRTVTAVRSGDFDGDGILDLAAFVSAYPGGYRLSYFRTFFGRGDGAFDPGADWLINLLWSGVAVADFGNDGRLDIAAAALYTEEIDVYLNFGDGTFQDLPYTVLPDSGGYGSTAGDYNEDGRLDVALSINNEPVAYLGTTGGRFVPAVPPAAFQFTSNFESSSADFDEDEHLDLVAALGNAGAVYAGNGDGTFQPPSYFSMNEGTFTHVVTADLDGDGHADFCLYDSGSFGIGIRLIVYFGRGDGTFDGPVETPTSGNGVGLLADDFNGDGRSDIALLVQGDPTLNVFLSNPSRGFLPPTSYAVGSGVIAFAAGDFREIHRPDILVSAYGQGVLRFENLGDGTFAAPVPTPQTLDASGMAVADLDGDGHLDMVANQFYEAAILKGHGDGTFDAPVEYAVGAVLSVFPGDPDGNGTIDVVFVNTDNQVAALTTLLNGELAVLVPDVSAVVGTAATLTARAGGFGPLTYQWRKGGVPLTDGGTVSGSQTATLTIDPVAFSDAGSYDVLVTDSCGPVTSNAATLSVEFADVPVASIFHDDILAIAAAGITGGCGGGNYCPTSPVRRDQMAVFLLKAEHGSAYTPPACTGVFADVPCPGPFTDWVEQLATEGVTGGCGSGNYCPDASVTRAQMAVFLLKTLLGSAYTPPAATGIFGDVPVGSFAADFIEDLYTRGITGGCSSSPLLYCPNNAVLRQQMATFLVRTFFP